MGPPKGESLEIDTVSKKLNTTKIFKICIF